MINFEMRLLLSIKCPHHTHRIETRILPDECEHCLLTLFTIYYYYLPPTKLKKGNVFTDVCNFVHGGGYVSSDGHQVPLAGHVYVQKVGGYVQGMGMSMALGYV